jgi:hypothetical protein
VRAADHAAPARAHVVLRQLPQGGRLLREGPAAFLREQRRRIKPGDSNKAVARLG